jgi:hypothetical protein
VLSASRCQTAAQRAPLARHSRPDGTRGNREPSSLALLQSGVREPTGAEIENLASACAVATCRFTAEVACPREFPAALLAALLHMVMSGFFEVQGFDMATSQAVDDCGQACGKSALYLAKGAGRGQRA